MKKKIGKKKYAWLLVLAPLAFMGCGKTVEQLTKTAHDLIDIGGKVYQETQENIEAVKKVVEPAAPAK